MTVLPSCANCGTALNGPFCSNCGQKASDLHRPIWWIIGEFMDAVFGYDSRTFRTIWLLFAEPGEFTRRYIDGRRASMLPPFRLFVIASIVFFLVLQLTNIAIVAFRVQTVTAPALTAAQVEKYKEATGGVATIRSGDRVQSIGIDLFVPADPAHRAPLTPVQKKYLEDAEREMANAAVKDDKGDDPEMTGWLRKSTTRVLKGYERALADPVALNGPLNVWLPRLMLVLVPVFALLLSVMHWRPRVFLSEHLVFSVHVHTVVFVALSLTALTTAIVGDSGFLWAVWLILLVYLWMAMYRVYGRSWWLTSIKFVFLIFVYTIVLTIGLALVFVVALSEL